MTGRTKVGPQTLAVTHVTDAEEIVSGGDDGQTYVATFASRLTADLFVDFRKLSKSPDIFGDRSE